MPCFLEIASILRQKTVESTHCLNHSQAEWNTGYYFAPKRQQSISGELMKKVNPYCGIPKGLEPLGWGTGAKHFCGWRKGALCL
jgi:hypothetical protein